MKDCSGLHCSGCGHGGGPAIGAGTVAALVGGALILANAHAIERAGLEVLRVLAITAAILAGLALVTVAAVVTVRVRRARSRRELARTNVPREIPAPSVRVLPPARSGISRSVAAQPGRWSKAGRWSR